MHTRSNLHILYTILVMTIVQVNCDQLMCYICDDCAKITKNTPKQACDETFFNDVFPLPPTTTTTDTPFSTVTFIITPTTTSQTTQSPKEATTVATTVAPVKTTTTTTLPTTESTIATTTELNTETTTDQTTTRETTTSISSFQNNDEALQTALLQPVNGDEETDQIHLRRLRAIAQEEFEYNCYSAESKVNGTTIISRGCTRTTPSQKVCIEITDNTTIYSKCFLCKDSLCNGSGSVGISMLAITSGLFLALLLRSSA